MKKTMTALALVGILAAFNAQAAGKDGVAAVVNGKQIKVADIKAAYDMNPKVKEKTSFDEFYNNTLDIFVDGEMVYQAAMADKITESKEYAAQLAEAKKELARKMYLDKKVRAAVNDAAVKKLYDDYKNTFHGEQEMNLKHILVDSEAKAKEVIAKLNDAGQFDKLAKQYSKEPAELGYLTKEQIQEMMVPEFAQATLKMKKGQFSQTPVKTQYGYHVILIDDVRDAKPEPLKKIEPQLKVMLAKKAMSDIIGNLQRKAEVVKYDAKGNKL